MSITPTQPAAKPASQSAIYFVLFTVLLDMIGFGLIIPVLPILIESVGDVPLSEASKIGGWMFFAYSAAQFVFGPLMGNLSDRFGRRPLLLLAIAGLMVDYVLQAWAPTLAWLYIGRAISGICGASWIIANAFIADVTAPEDRAKYFGMMGAAFGLGFVLGPALGGILGDMGPRVPFWVAAGIAAVNLALGWFILPESLAQENRRAFDWRRANPFGAFKVFQSYRGVLPMCLVIFFFFFFSSVYPSTWPFWGMAKFGWSPSTVGLTLAIFGLLMAATQGGLTGPLVKAFGEHRVVMAGFVCATIAATGYGLAGSLTMVIVLMMVHTPEGFIHPLLSSEMTKAVPENAQGELQGGLSAVLNVSQLAGTVFFSQIFAFFMRPEHGENPAAGYLIAGGGIGATFLLYLWFARRAAA
jgi:MFS transporter, DHA1 family, tetracycline resistance protein